MLDFVVHGTQVVVLVVVVVVVEVVVVPGSGRRTTRAPKPTTAAASTTAERSERPTAAARPRLVEGEIQIPMKSTTRNAPESSAARAQTSLTTPPTAAPRIASGMAATATLGVHDGGSRPVVTPRSSRQAGTGARMSVVFALSAEEWDCDCETEPEHACKAAGDP